MVIAIFFILISIYILTHCYRLLKEILPDPHAETDSAPLGIKKLIGNAIGLMLYFSTGVFAFTTGVGSLTEKLILALQ